MAGKRPFFLTGSNAVVRLNGKTMAFCTDINYSVLVPHALPKVLGMYEPISVEPLSYEVQGSFTLIRYAAGIKGIVSENAAPSGVADGGNGVGQWGPDDVGGLVFGADGRAKDALNPSTFGQSTGFDIDIFQKVAGKNGIETVQVAKIRNCRIIKADFGVGKNAGPATERFQFSALYLDEDSFKAAVSGVGQNFA